MRIQLLATYLKLLIKYKKINKTHKRMALEKLTYKEDIEGRNEREKKND